MSNRHGEGPDSQLCWWYPRQRARMARTNEQKDAEHDNQEAGANPDLPLPFDQGCQQREGSITTSIASR